MLLAAQRLFRFIRIDIRMVEQTRFELCSQNPRDSFVEVLLRYFAIFHRSGKTGVSGGRRQFHIDSGIEREHSRCFCVCNYMLKVCKLFNRLVVRSRQSLKAPLCMEGVAAPASAPSTRPLSSGEPLLRT